MSTTQEYQQIGPALRCRYTFESGIFKLDKTFVGWNLVREDIFGHQVSWDTDPTWKTTYREAFIYKVDEQPIKHEIDWPVRLFGLLEVLKNYEESIVSFNCHRIFIISIYCFWTVITITQRPSTISRR